MSLHFDVKKAIQIAGVLLRFEEGKMEYLRLLKLLYIADRESLKEWGCPISMSSTVGMDHGPVSREVHDLIKGAGAMESLWAGVIRTHGHNVTLLSDPGRGLLSIAEIDKLNEVSERYEHTDTWRVADLTLEFPEYAKNVPAKGSSAPIPLGDILDGVGRSADKASIIADLSEKAAYEKFFEGAKSEVRRHVLVDG